MLSSLAAQLLLLDVATLEKMSDGGQEGYPGLGFNKGSELEIVRPF